jgi:hypothetical protein
LKKPLTIGIAVACCVVLAVGFTLFKYEVKTLFWHLTHGFTQQLSDLEIGVPLKYNVNATTSRAIQISTMPGHLRARLKAPFGAISIIRAKNDADGAEIAELDNRIAVGGQGQGFRLVNTRSLEVAAMPMVCREQLADDFRSYGPVYSVHCQADSKLLFVQFYGSAALLNEFYSVASGIRKTPMR